MPEPLNNQRIKRLEAFCLELRDKPSRKLWDSYKDELSTVTPWETMVLVDFLMQLPVPFDQLKPLIRKMMNAFSSALQGYSWDVPAKPHFLHLLMQENRLLETELGKIKEVVKSLNRGHGENTLQAGKTLKEFLVRLRGFESHYLKKENILFPFIEKLLPEYRCVQLMWSIHDDIRGSIRALEERLTQNPLDLKEINRLIGVLFFDIYGIIFREEKVLFPAVLPAISDNLWHQMLEQSREYPALLPYGTAHGLPKKQTATTGSSSPQDGVVRLESGTFTLQELETLFAALPVDITFIDSQDRVKFFSNPPQRIFPRSQAIIGRKVQNCHPPESVATVNTILDEFKQGEKDQARFWIALHGRFILIRYYALRDQELRYLGTLEVSQDITEIKNISGEKRLLDWEE